MKSRTPVVEDELDREFFAQPQIQSMKLNKGEKRVLKFAIKRGEKIDEIPNLKEWLAAQVEVFKASSTVKKVKAEKKNDKYNRGNNNSNKFYAFTQIEDGGYISD